jgi:hypothetical protein
MSQMGRRCSLIPGLDVKLSTRWANAPALDRRPPPVLPRRPMWTSWMTANFLDLMIVKTS